ncbi:hypothetical protein TIFTF001_033620 [Ficus carica]|uniref:Uncharacterized protein n=1 Tax=Ficus carica TaxID=3494 RepID=A0AA88DZL9_FICCA|nr:hypothetical protein TIFTF001_033620 [Ficus carica]
MISAIATTTIVAPMVFVTMMKDLDNATAVDGLLWASEISARLGVGAPSASSGDSDREALEIVISSLDEI